MWRPGNSQWMGIPTPNLTLRSCRKEGGGV